MDVYFCDPSRYNIRLSLPKKAGSILRDIKYSKVNCRLQQTEALRSSKLGSSIMKHIIRYRISVLRLWISNKLTTHFNLKICLPLCPMQTFERQIFIQGVKNKRNKHNFNLIINRFNLLYSLIIKFLSTKKKRNYTQQFLLSLYNF